MPPKRKSETSGTVRTHVLGEEVFTTDQVAHDLHISVRTVLRAIHDGKLKARRVGKQYLVAGAKFEPPESQRLGMFELLSRALCRSILLFTPSP
jgi:excisionase family DNA binding protein